MSPLLKNRVEIKRRVIWHTQVIMHVITTTDLLLARDLPWADVLALRMIQAHYSNRMLGLLADLPSDISQAVLDADKRTSGAVMRFSLN